jgi:hypothetical protein
MDSILVLYGQRSLGSLYEKQIVNSKKNLIVHLPLIIAPGHSLISNFNNVEECSAFVKKFKKWVIVPDYYTNLVPFLKSIHDNNFNVDIIVFGFSPNSDLFQNWIDAKRNKVEYKDLEIQKEMTKYLFKPPISFFKYNENLIFDPTTWISTFYVDIPTLVDTFDNNDYFFLNANSRFGISIYRENIDRLSIVKELLNYSNLSFYNEELITVKNIDRAYFNEYDIEFLEAQYKKWITYNDKGRTLNEISNFWLETYKLCINSKIDIVMETYNIWDDIEKWQINFTEKTLKPILSAKPFLLSDIISYKLLKNWGFKIDYDLYGEELINEFEKEINEEDIIKQTSETKLPLWSLFAKRLVEIDRMDEIEFNQMYENSLVIAKENKSILKNWKMWYDDIERWFTKI